MKNTIKIVLTFFILILGTFLMDAQPPSKGNCPGSAGCPEVRQGGSNDVILCYWAPFGNIANVGTELRWLNADTDVASYDVFIIDELLDTIKLNSTNLAIWLDFPSMSNLVIGDTYTIKIRSVPPPGGGDIWESMDIKFTLKSLSDFNQIMQDLNNDSQFNNLTGFDKSLRKIDFLQSSNWNNEAIKAFEIHPTTEVDFLKLENKRNSFWTAMFP